MKPNTLSEILDQHNEGIILSQSRAEELILDLVSKAIIENCGLTVAEGEQLARRVKVALS